MPCREDYVLGGIPEAMTGRQPGTWPSLDDSTSVETQLADRERKPGLGFVGFSFGGGGREGGNSQ